MIIETDRLVNKRKSLLTLLLLFIAVALTA